MHIDLLLVPRSQILVISLTCQIFSALVFDICCLPVLNHRFQNAIWCFLYGAHSALYVFNGWLLSYCTSTVQVRHTTVSCLYMLIFLFFPFYFFFFGFRYRRQTITSVHMCTHRSNNVCLNFTSNLTANLSNYLQTYCRMHKTIISFISSHSKIFVILSIFDRQFLIIYHYLRQLSACRSNGSSILNNTYWIDFSRGTFNRRAFAHIFFFCLALHYFVLFTARKGDLLSEIHFKLFRNTCKYCVMNYMTIYMMCCTFDRLSFVLHCMFHCQRMTVFHCILKLSLFLISFYFAQFAICFELIKLSYICKPIIWKYIDKVWSWVNLIVKLKQWIYIDFSTYFGMTEYTFLSQLKGN